MKILSLIFYALKKDEAVLEKGQYTLTLLFFVMGVALLQAALNAIAPGLTFLVLNTVFLINSQIAVRIGYGVMALIALYLP
jgi:uncharacterized membrane protein